MEAERSASRVQVVQRFDSTRELRTRHAHGTRLRHPPLRHLLSVGGTRPRAAVLLVRRVQNRVVRVRAVRRPRRRAGPRSGVDVRSLQPSRRARCGRVVTERRWRPIVMENVARPASQTSPAVRRGKRSVDAVATRSRGSRPWSMAGSCDCGRHGLSGEFTQTDANDTQRTLISDRNGMGADVARTRGENADGIAVRLRDAGGERDDPADRILVSNLMRERKPATVGEIARW